MNQLTFVLSFSALMIWKLMTHMQTELKQRLWLTARAPEPWSTSVTCSLGVKRGKQLHSKGGLAEKNFSMKSMTPCLNMDFTSANSVCVSFGLQFTWLVLTEILNVTLARFSYHLEYYQWSMTSTGLTWWCKISRNRERNQIILDFLHASYPFTTMPLNPLWFCFVYSSS